MKAKKSAFFFVLLLSLSSVFFSDVTSALPPYEKGPMNEEQCPENQGWNVTCGGEQDLCTSQIIC